MPALPQRLRTRDLLVGVLVGLLVGVLVGAAATGLVWAASGSTTEVRIAARLLDDGRVEVALQQ
ncbi:MAG: hypothetical protein OXG27_14745, partial [Chloroflexi bacterium]|nr:hypothetical protein [Chloroflexota bacterium]